MIAAELCARGWTNRRIATRLKVDEDTVSVWLSEDAVKARVDELRSGAATVARKVLEDAGYGAAATVVDMSSGRMRRRGAMVQLKAAFGVLDRIGVPPSKQVLTDDPTGLPDDVLREKAAEILKRDRERGSGGGTPAS